MSRQYGENKLGVHLMGTLGGGEFTLCGDSFDIDQDEDDPGLALTTPKANIVTCQKCIEAILHCRGVKVAELREASDD